MGDTLAVLIRGINVGRAKRVAMGDLRALLKDLGYGDARTLLNSGNVVFSAPGASPGEAAGRIEKAIEDRLGVSARVTALTGDELADAVADNPLSEVADNPSRLQVAVLFDPEDGLKLQPLLKRDWTPEAFALGARAAYLWCPEGVLKSPLTDAVNQILGDAVTTRNWATMNKLNTLAKQVR